MLHEQNKQEVICTVMLSLKLVFSDPGLLKQKLTTAPSPYLAEMLYVITLVMLKFQWWSTLTFCTTNYKIPLNGRVAFKKWSKPGLFLLIFGLYRHNIYRIIKQDSNSDCWNEGKYVDHHHCPIDRVVARYSVTVNSNLNKIVKKSNKQITFRLIFLFLHEFKAMNENYKATNQKDWQ